MLQAFCLACLLYVATSNTAFAQGSALPRDAQKLIDRARAFWTAIVGGRRSEALGFVLPEKRDLFLSGSPIPILHADVIGLDLTNDPQRAQVRTNIQALSRDTTPGTAAWSITDVWVWRGNNWYLDLRAAPDIFPRRSTTEDADIGETERKIDQNFAFPRNPVELGRLIEGQQLRYEIPIKYSGDIPVSAEVEIPNSLADLDAASASQITSRTDNLVLLLNTEGWQGPFDLPLPLKIRNGAATVKRTLVLRGTVFAPVTFRLDESKLQPDEPFSIFVRNNSSEDARVAAVRSDGKFQILKLPEKIPANTEVEIVVKLRPGDSPDRLNVLLENTIEGRSIFTYRFQPGNR